MKKVKRRAACALLVAAALVLGLAVYVLRFARDGGDWAAFSANASIYQGGVLNVGTVTDRNGVVLAHAGNGIYYYAENPLHRAACLHAVGDYPGRVNGALKLFSNELGGYDSVSA